MFGDYTSEEGQRVLDSFTEGTHQGDRSLLKDAAVDTALWVGETVVINRVAKLIPDSVKDKARDLITGNKLDGKSNLLPGDIKALSEKNISNTGETILGHHPGYIDKANSRGASYFDIGDSWTDLNDVQKKAANHHLLDEISKNGDKVNLSLPKNKIRPGSWLSDEINYLTTEKGYKWVNQWSLKKVQ